MLMVIAPAACLSVFLHITFEESRVGFRRLTWYKEGTFGCRTKLGHSSSDVSNGVGSDINLDTTLVTRLFTVTSASSMEATFLKRLLRSGPGRWTKSYFVIIIIVLLAEFQPQRPISTTSLYVLLSYSWVVENSDLTILNANVWKERQFPVVSTFSQLSKFVSPYIAKNSMNVSSENLLSVEKSRCNKKLLSLMLWCHWPLLVILCKWDVLIV